MSFRVEIGGGNGKEAYTDREALATLRTAYRRPAREPWKTAGEGGDQWRERKARRQRQAFPTGPPPDRPAPEPDPKSVEGFKRRRETCIPIADTPAEEYLIGRGIPADLARAAKCAYSPAWGQLGAAAVFPIRDQAGKTIAANGRAITPGYEGGKTKQTFGPMAGGIFYTPGALDADPVAITEAPIDALTLHLAGVPAIATCGTSNLPDWVKARLATPAPNTLPGHSRTVYVAHDNDTPGESAAERIGASLTLAKVHRLRPARKDWNADLIDGGLDALRQWLESEGVHTDPPQKGELVGALKKAAQAEETEDCTSSALLATENDSSAISGDSVSLDQPRAADPAEVADRILSALDGRPLPIRICSGVTISDPNRFATATAWDLCGQSEYLAQLARARLDQLGILKT